MTSTLSKAIVCIDHIYIAVGVSQDSYTDINQTMHTYIRFREDLSIFGALHLCFRSFHFSDDGLYAAFAVSTSACYQLHGLTEQFSTSLATEHLLLASPQLPSFTVQSSRANIIAVHGFISQWTEPRINHELIDNGTATFSFQALYKVRCCSSLALIGKYPGELPSRSHDPGMCAQHYVT